MGLQIKSTKSFKILIGVSALLISGMAATFSITGIATLFAGYFLTVAFMMGALEFAKIVVASFLARYWSSVSKILRGYFIAALMVLILITSGGIFGYLSDAYQRTKGDYSIVEKQTSVLQAKKSAFAEKKLRLDSDRQLELGAKTSNQRRADSLTSRRQSVSDARKDIKSNDDRLAVIETKISAAEDSIGVYDLQIANLESKNIKGELGPLKYISIIFNTDMDNVVKYFIFMLIFVFDPLAVLLFVSLNTIIRKEELEKAETTGTIIKDAPVKIVDEPIVEPVVKEVIETIAPDPIVEVKEEPVPVEEIKKKVETDQSEEFVKELITELEKSKLNDIPVEEVKTIEKIENDKSEHDFYHDTNTPGTLVPDISDVKKKSANYHPGR